jgi:hypothetical protein
MSITFANYKKINRLREPNFERCRAVYRGPRSSFSENLELGLFLEDTKKIAQELVSIDEGISENQKIFIHLVSDEDFNKIEDIEFYYDSGSGAEIQSPERLEVKVLHQLSGTLNLLNSKVTRLERGKYNV